VECECDGRVGVVKNAGRHKADAEVRILFLDLQQAVEKCCCLSRGVMDDGVAVVKFWHNNLICWEQLAKCWVVFYGVFSDVGEGGNFVSKQGVMLRPVMSSPGGGPQSKVKCRFAVWNSVPRRES
jgi:hypothetical protein